MTASHVAVAMTGGITSHDVPTTKSSTAPARPWNRCKVALSAVLLVTLAGLLALYVNVLNSVPAFVDESGDSTIELLVGVEDDGITVHLKATALPSSTWHTYDLQSSTCTIEVSSKKIEPPMQLLDFAVDVDQFHVEPETPASIEISAAVTPSPTWPTEQARYNLDPRMGMPAAIALLADGAPVSTAAVCQFDVRAKLFNTIDTGVLTITKSFDLDDVFQHGQPDGSPVVDYYSTMQKMFTAMNFENITSSMLSGNAVESDLAAPIEILLSEMSLATDALKEFNVRVEPIDVAVGVGSAAVSNSGRHLPPRSEWTVRVGSVQLDLQKSKCVESGSVSVSAATRGNLGESTSVLTPAAHAYAEMASAGSARFPLEFQTQQLWLEYLFGRDHATTAQFTTTSSKKASEEEGGAGVANSTAGHRSRRNDESGWDCRFPLRKAKNSADTTTRPGQPIYDPGDGAPKTASATQCFEVNVDDSSVVEMCVTDGGCKVGLAGQIAFETFPVHYNGEATIDFAEQGKFAIDATAFNGDGPRTAAISGVLEWLEGTSDAEAVSFTGKATVNDEDFSIDTGFDWSGKYTEEQGTFKSGALGVRVKVADASGPIFSVDAKPSIEADTLKLTLRGAKFNDGDAAWETSVAVQCDHTEKGLGPVSDSTDETHFCDGSMDLFKDSAREMQVKLTRASYDVTGDSGGVELKMDGTQKDAPISWDSVVDWNLLPSSIEQEGSEQVPDDDNSYSNAGSSGRSISGVSANVAIALTSAGGKTFTFSSSPTLDADASTVAIDATIGQAGKDPIVVDMRMNCGGVEGSMYKEMVDVDGTARPLANPGSGEETKFCTASLDLVKDGAKDYSFKVSKAAFDVAGQSGGFALDTTGTVLGDDVEFNFLLGWETLMSIEQFKGSPGRRGRRDQCDSPDTDNAKGYCNGQEYDFSQIQPSDGNSYFSGPDANNEYMFYFQMTGGGLPSDVGSMPYCTFEAGTNTGNAAGQGEITGDSCFPLGLGAQQSWEIDTSQNPQVIQVTFSGGQEGRQTVLSVTCDPSADDPTFSVKGETRTLVYEVDITSKYACSGSPSPPSPPSPPPPPSPYYSNNDGDDRVTDDFFSNPGASCVTSSGKPCRMNTGPCKAGSYTGEWYDQPQSIDSTENGHLSSCDVWWYGSTQTVKLHHKTTFVGRSGDKFELTVDPEIQPRDDNMGFTAGVPASAQMNGALYNVDLSLECADSGMDNDGIEVACSAATMSFKQDGKERAKVDLEKVAISNTWDPARGTVDINGRAFADSSSAMYELVEYSVNSDIQWAMGDDDVFELNPVIVGVATVAAEPVTVFGLAGQTVVGPSARFNDVQASFTIEMETSANKRVKFSLGDLDAISVIDSAPWYLAKAAETPADQPHGEQGVETHVVVHTTSTSQKHSKGDTTLLLDDGHQVAVGDTLTIGTGKKQETAVVTAVTPAGTPAEVAALKALLDAAVKAMADLQAQVDALKASGEDATAAKKAFAAAKVNHKEQAAAYAAASKVTVTLATPLQNTHRAGTDASFTRPVETDGKSGSMLAVAIVVPICLVLVGIVVAVFVSKNSKASRYTSQANYQLPNTFDNPGFSATPAEANPESEQPYGVNASQA